MEPNKIEIYKERDFEEFISTPISFFFQEFKFLAKLILFFVGPFVLIASVFSAYYNVGNGADFTSLLSGNFANKNQGQSFLLQIFELFQNVMLYSTIGVYIKLYVQNGSGNFTTEDVWKGISKFYFPVLGGQFLGGLMAIVGLIFLIIPGLYIGVAMTILIPIIIFEEEGVSKAISRAFELIKGNWWLTFGVFIVFGIIFLMFVGIIAAVIGGIFAFGGYSPIISTISGTIIKFITIVLTAVYALVPVFLYSSFIAEKEDPNLLERIKNISKIESNEFFDKTNTFVAKAENKSIKEEEKEEDVWGKLIDQNQSKKSESETNKEKQTENKDKEETIEKDNNESNRFLEADDNNRFKPKY